MNFFNREISIIKLLVEEKNISRAAQRAGLQQPALSKILMQLEKRLKRKLFSRTSGGLLPSAFVIELNKIITKTETLWEKSFNDLLDKETRVEGRFSIGCHGVIAQAYLSSTYVELRARHPHLDLVLELGPSKVITQKVALGEIHFGIVANPVKHPELVIKPICQEHVYLYSSGHLESESLIYYHPDMINVSKLIRQFKTYRYVPVSDYHLILRLVERKQNQGAILPSSIGLQLPALQIKSRSLYKADIKLIYRLDLHKSHAVSVILQELRDLK